MSGRVRWRNLIDDPSPAPGERLGLAALTAASWAYRGGLALDRAWHSLRGPWRPPVPSVCIGNVTVGGTGKTTLVRHIARRLQGAGVCAAVILRGYGRRDPRATRVVHDGHTLLEGPDTAGDEAVMLGAGLGRTAVVVGPSRRASSEIAVSELGARALLYDDGLQHWALSAHRTIALWDATADPTRARLLPRGALREPLAALRRFDTLILTRCEATPECTAVAATLARVRGEERIPMARHTAVALRDGEGRRRPPASLAGQCVLAFSSLGNPGALRATLAGIGADVREERVFPDHHRYSVEEVRSLGEAAAAQQVHAVVTTEKDWAKLPGTVPVAIEVLEIDFELFGDGSPIDEIVAYLSGSEVPPDG